MGEDQEGRKRKWSNYGVLLFLLALLTFFQLPSYKHGCQARIKAIWEGDCKSNLRAVAASAELYKNVFSPARSYDFDPSCAVNADKNISPSCDLNFNSPADTHCTYIARPLPYGDDPHGNFEVRAKGKPGTGVEGREMVLKRDGTLIELQ